MSGSTPECRHVRLAIGADPAHLTPDVVTHLTSCAACSRFQDETRALDLRLRAALELPLPQFRRRAPPMRRFALAASVALALVVAGGAWLFRPGPALAGEVVAHLAEEKDSWDRQRILPASDVAAVLKKAGVEFDARLPVIYASACPFHGHRIPHLVVQTASGPMTVMILAHEKIDGRQDFSENGYTGVLLPAGEGSVAVLMRGGAVPEGDAQAMVNGVRPGR